MRRIALFNHKSDALSAKSLAAALRKIIDLNAFEIWQRDFSANAFADVRSQESKVVDEAWVVLVMIGDAGVDADFQNLHQGLIAQRIASDGAGVGRIVIRIGSSNDVRGLLSAWPVIEMMEASSAANDVLRMVGLTPKWSDATLLQQALAHLGNEAGDSQLGKYLVDISQLLVDGKSLTLLVTPYASVDETYDDSCPSAVRRQLLELIEDRQLRALLAPLIAEDATTQSAPVMWQDHLATICLLSGCSRELVSTTIEAALERAPGDVAGSPSGLFLGIGTLAAHLNASSLPRSAGLPLLTVLSVCAGLRNERALVAAGVPFERITLMFSRGKRPELHHLVYRPSEEKSRRAREGITAFMPDGVVPESLGETPCIRLIKLFGSRDLDSGVPSGDLGQFYDLTGQLRNALEPFVVGVGTGAYVVLGGGLGTPPIQAAHAVLLRGSLEKPEKRPRLAVVPASSASLDPFRKLEAGRLAALSQIQDSGFDRLRMVVGDPVRFVEALSIALAH